MSILSIISGLVTSATNIQLDTPIGLLALLLLIPFLILYLIRPKPKSAELPSLMFFMKHKGRSVLKSFLRYILKDILFFIQLLILLLIIASIAGPFTEYEHDIASDNTILVLDLSASMHTKENNGQSRLDIAKDHIRKLAGGKNTLILAKNTQYLALENENSERTITYINTLSASHTPTKLGEAILLGSEMLKGSEGKIFVISDFISTNGLNPSTAKALVESKGQKIEFINVGSNDRDNIGIIDLIVKDQFTTVFIKNYNEREETVNIEINGERDNLILAGKSTQDYTFQTIPGQSIIKLDVNDDFSIDNTAYVSTPVNLKKKVHLITSDKSKFLETALLSSPIVDLTVSILPVISKEEFDVIIIHNVNPEQILPGTFKEVLEQTKNGAAILVHAQGNSLDIDYGELIPLELISKNGAVPIQINQITQFTKNVEFGIPSAHFETKTGKNVFTVVSALNSSILSYKNYEKGMLVYYGIIEEESEFKLSPYYPIFWNELIKFLTNHASLSTSHKKTGEIYIIDGEIKKPNGDEKTGIMTLEETGFYTGKTVVAVNLVNAEESNVNLESEEAKKILKLDIEETTEIRKYYLEKFLIFLVMLLLLIELWIIKRRGDI